ncbi:MAG: MFS transporter, partial [Actinomycetota bacterium]
MTADRVDHRSIGILGLVTIVTYGSWYYAFGVLFDPIRTDTGWSEAALALSFSIGTVALGLVSIGGGRLLDRTGARTVLLLAGIGGGAALALTSFATSIVAFVIGAALAMVFLGAFGFYHTTMTMAVRLNPGRPSRAIAVLTIWGAFASAVYLPATAALVDRLAWRPTVRILAAVVVVVLVAAALLLPDPPSRPRPVPQARRPVRP